MSKNQEINAVKIEISMNKVTIVDNNIITFIIENIPHSIAKKFGNENKIKVKGFTKLTDSIPKKLLIHSLISATHQKTAKEGREGQLHFLVVIFQELLSTEKLMPQWAITDLDKLLKNRYVSPLIKLIFLAIIEPEQVNQHFTEWESIMNAKGDPWLCDELEPFDVYEQFEFWNQTYQALKPNEKVEETANQLSSWTTDTWREYFDQFRARYFKIEDLYMAWSLKDQLKNTTSFDELSFKKWHTLTEWVLLLALSSDNKGRDTIEEYEKLNAELEKVRERLLKLDEQAQQVKEPAKASISLLSEHESPLLFATEFHDEYEMWFGAGAVTVQSDPRKLKAQKTLKQLPVHRTIYLYAPGYAVDATLELEKFMRSEKRRIMIHQGDVRAWARSVIADLEGGVLA